MIINRIDFPEIIGVQTIAKVDVKGNIFDLSGEPVDKPLLAGLNKPSTRYKNQHQISGAAKQIDSDEDGAFTARLVETTSMTPDSYYRLEINGEIFRKIIPDFPLSLDFNDLLDY